MIHFAALSNYRLGDWPRLYINYCTLDVVHTYHVA